MIYRDFYNGPEVLQTIDFVDEQHSGALTSFLSSIRAIRNTDECENVAGGLKVTGSINKHAATSGTKYGMVQT